MMPTDPKECETEQDWQTGNDHYPVDVQWDNPRTKKIVTQTNGRPRRISGGVRCKTNQTVIMRRASNRPKMRYVSRLRRRERG